MIQVQALDTKLFLLINHLPHTLGSDIAFAALSIFGDWGIGWMAVALYRMVRYGKKERILLVAVSVAVATALGISVAGKQMTARPRPQFSLKQTIVRGEDVNSFAFPSSHAAMSFAAAGVFAAWKKKWGIPSYLLAGFIAFSRIYLGRHFPGDVLGGAIMGTGIGYGIGKYITRRV